MILRTLIIIIVIITGNVSNSFTANIDMNNQKLRSAKTDEYDFNKNGIMDLGDVIMVLQILSGTYSNDNTINKAGIILDGSMCPSTGALIKMEETIVITPDFGQIKGYNLFHSFQTFNIQSSETATFSGPDTINNIIIRITGDETSCIDGQFKSDLPNATIYLLNPNGVMIGKNASVDTMASLHISTADYLVMEDAEPFIVNAAQPVLSISQPVGFGILETGVGIIDITHNEQIEISTGETISLIGSEINIKNSHITASEGQINIVSLSSCEISLSDSGVTVNGEYRSGNINLLNSSRLIVDGTGSGNIFILGGYLLLNETSFLSAITNGDKNGGDIDLLVENLNMYDGSFIQSEIISGENNSGGDINITATDTVHLSNNSRIISSTDNSRAGRIRIEAKNISISQASGINSQTTGFGAGSDIFLFSSEAVLLTDSVLSMDSETSGNSGNIRIESHNIFFTNGSTIVSETSGTGHGGQISIHAEKHITLAGTNDSGIASTISNISSGTGNAGKIYLDASQISIEDGGIINTATVDGGFGGNIEINTEILELIGVNPHGENTDGFNSAIISVSDQTGKLGDIHISSKDLLIKEGAYINTSSCSNGDAGTIQIIGESLTVQGIAPVIEEDQFLESQIIFNENHSPTDGIKLSGIYANSDSQEYSVQTDGNIIIDFSEMYLHEAGSE